MMVQRTLTAKSLGDAKKAYIFMGYIAFFVFVLFFGLGILFYSYYGGREFENGNTIILQFAADYGMPGLMGIIAAAVMAASMSSLDSAFNSLSTVSTIDFYQKYFVRDGTPEHYLKVTRIFTAIWALVIIIPAIMYSKSTGSILETLSQVGSYFVGAQLGMFALGFFSRHTSERGLLVGTMAGFVVVWYVSANTDVAWPWFCLIGALSNIVISVTASILIDGFQKEWSPYSIKGQLAKFRREGLEEKDGGWYLVPGRFDRLSYWLLGFFFVVMAGLLAFEQLI
jgi:SSS family solute:Na+ symporter